METSATITGITAAMAESKNPVSGFEKESKDCKQYHDWMKTCQQIKYRKDTPWMDRKMAGFMLWRVKTRHERECVVPELKQKGFLKR